MATHDAFLMQINDDFRVILPVLDPLEFTQYIKYLLVKRFLFFMTINDVMYIKFVVQLANQNKVM